MIYDKWRFFDYVNNDGSNPIKDWYQKLSDEAKEMMDGLLKNCSKTSNHLEWPSRSLTRKNEKHKVWEFKFIADKRQYRLLCTFDKAKKVVILAGCYHKGVNYTPKDAIDIAYNRAKKLFDGRAETHERKIPEDI